MGAPSKQVDGTPCGNGVGRLVNTEHDLNVRTNQLLVAAFQHYFPQILQK
jgi:hypothetical protein